MPELPEVETVRRGLLTLIIAKRIHSVSHDTPKSFPNATSEVNQFVLGSTITDIRRRGKVLLIDLSSEYTLVIHLKMTGQLVFRSSKTKTSSGEYSYDEKLSSGPKRTDSTNKGAAEGSRHKYAISLPEQATGSVAVAGDEESWGAGHPNDSLVGELPDKSTRVIFRFDDGNHLYFNDQRKFGWVKLFPTIELPNIDFMKRVGPEPLEDTLTHKDFIQRMRRRDGTIIKAALLDQTVVAGIGNIYADEGLWGAYIHPARRVRDVSDKELQTLLDEVRYVLTLAIEKGGSTDKNYVNAEGKRGSYIDFARVFRREGLPCPRHPDVLVEKSRVAGRGTHTCPVCQILTQV